MTRSGIVALAGAPNVGKSSLLNALVGSHLAIVSPRPQATRLPVTGVVTQGDTQFVFVDLPGLLDPSYLLQARMMASAEAALREADVILRLAPADDATASVAGPPLPGADRLAAPILNVFTKGDLASPGRRAELARHGTVVSIEDPASLVVLLSVVRSHLPEREFAHDPDDIGTQPLRFFVTEFLREAAFELLQEEVPYAVAAEIEEFREGVSPVYIRVTLLVERESQKGIVIGRGGQMIKAIGAHARARIEALLGAQVYLDLRAKVLPGWRRKPAALSRLGFPIASSELQ
jgi:GTP-binding protein Era